MKSKTQIAAVALPCVFDSLLFCSTAKQNGDAVATVTKLIDADIKASLAGDTNFVKTNYVDGYIEGTSLGTWMTKEQFMDTPRQGKQQERKRSQSGRLGDTVIARFAKL